MIRTALNARIVTIPHALLAGCIISAPKKAIATPQIGNSHLIAETFTLLLEQWLWAPGAEPVVENGMVAALRAVFPYVEVLGSAERGLGEHFLASEHPIVLPPAEELVKRLPRAAVSDLLEWETKEDAASLFGKMMEQRWTDRVLASSEGALPFTDDRPLNEYFLVRTVERGLRDRLGFGAR